MLVSRSAYHAMAAERDEWRRRAEAEAKVVHARQKARRRLGARIVSAAWLVVIGLLLGGTVVPREQDAPVVAPDYAGCIQTARYEHPLEDQHQELVNALYACGVYQVPVG